MTLRIRPAREDDLDRIEAIVSQAFNIPAAGRDRIRSLPLAEARVAEEDGRVVACLRATPVGQFWGGRSVPMAAIRAVGVAPEARGRQVAGELMAASVREAREAGRPISSLYPATVPLYRRAGYEYSATRTWYEARLRDLPRSGSLEPEPWQTEDDEDVAACYRTWVEADSGPIDRTEEWWRTLLTPWTEQPFHRFLVRESGRVTGAIAYSQEKPNPEGFRYDLACQHLSWTTPEAGRSLLAFAARHRSMGDRLMWWGPPAEPLAGLVEEQDVRATRTFRLMTRITDLPGAFEARGWRADAAASVELHVTDAIVPENDGAWRIEVVGGAAKVSRTDKATARIGIGPLASMWAGYTSARDARRIGWLDADDETAAALEAMFAGPAPWIYDFF